jgi:RNase H-fold protein (predicted Holliday junction resolvase)
MRVADEAKAALIVALAKTAKNAPKAKLTDEQLSSIRNEARELEGRLTYEVKLGDEYVTDFKANSLLEAKRAAAKLMKKHKAKGKHTVRRLTKAEQMSRQVAYACSPESEAYWCS